MRARGVGGPQGDADGLERAVEAEAEPQDARAAVAVLAGERNEGADRGARLRPGERAQDGDDAIHGCARYGVWRWTAGIRSDTIAPMHAAVAIRQRRQEAHLGRRELARRAGTSPATLLRYERGEITPGTDTLERILDSVLTRRRRWPSLPALVPALLEAFEAGQDSWAWRCACEILDDEAAATDEETRLFVSRRPEISGNRRVDALVAAFAEHVCVERGITPPPWTWEPRVCTPWWFVAGLPGYERLAMREAPPSFATRGIFVTRRDLLRA